MWLRTDLDGVFLNLLIKNYEADVDGNWADQWCNVECLFSNNCGLSLSATGDIILSCEVDELVYQLERLLDDQMSEDTVIELIEPDFKFILHPKRDRRKTSQYVKEGYEFEDISMEWQTFLWNGCPTGNYLTVTFYREDIEILLTYLLLVSKKLNASDPSVVSLCEKGLFHKYR